MYFTVIASSTPASSVISITGIKTWYENKHAAFIQLGLASQIKTLGMSTRTPLDGSFSVNERAMPPWIRRAVELVGWCCHHSQCCPQSQCCHHRRCCSQSLLGIRAQFTYITLSNDGSEAVSGVVAKANAITPGIFLTSKSKQKISKYKQHGLGHSRKSNP